MHKITPKLFCVFLILLSAVGCVSTGELKKKQLIIDEKNLSLERTIKEKENLEHDLHLILSEDIRAKNILKSKEKIEKLESLNAELKSEIVTLQEANKSLENRVFEVQNTKDELKKSEQLVHELNKKIELLSNPLSLAALDDWLLVQKLQGSLVFAQDDENTYLGAIDFTGQSSESIFNEFGTHGSEFSSYSIWNEFGTFGSEFSSYSPFNEFTSTPPMIVKNKSVIGHLTENEFLTGAVSISKIKYIYEKLN